MAPEGKSTRQVIDPTLMKLLVCPIDHAPLTVDARDLVCSSCGRRYPVTNGVPNMLVDERK